MAAAATDGVCVRVTGCREWDCGKLFVLKMLNLIVLYVVKQETARLNILEQSFCPIAAAGTQFFWLIVTDVTVRGTGWLRVCGVGLTCCGVSS